MPKPKALPSPTDPVLRRAEELDALDAILPSIAASSWQRY